MMKLGIVTHFDAAHSLPGYEGKCKNIHGHTYKVEVTVEGEIDEKTKFVIDYNDLKAIIEDLLNKLDHRYLNEILDYPSCEMIVTHIKEELSKELKSRGLSIELLSIKLWEGKNKWVMIE